MKTPKMLKKINNTDKHTISEIEKMIKEALQKEHIGSYPIEGLTIQQLDLLSEYAKENDILITLRAEHSNFHQGTLVSLVRKDLAAGFIKYL